MITRDLSLGCLCTIRGYVEDKNKEMHVVICSTAKQCQSSHAFDTTKSNGRSGTAAVDAQRQEVYDFDIVAKRSLKFETSSKHETGYHLWIRISAGCAKGAGLRSFVFQIKFFGFCRGAGRRVSSRSRKITRGSGGAEQDRYHSR